MHSRILVHFKQRSAERIAQFTESVVDVFGGIDDVALVEAQLLGNRLVVSKAQQGHQAIRLKRPSFCPIHNLSQVSVKQLPDETRERGTDVGCALLLESSDGRILLTRRASHLRTFPGVWVPPGGHLEENESFVDAVLRELKEETGLNVKPEDCVDKSMPILALWESTYPPLLSIGPPVRHHLVAYMHAKLCPPNSVDALSSCLRLDPNEVSAATWLTRDMVEAIVAASSDFQKPPSNVVVSQSFPSPNAQFPCVMNVTVVDASGHHSVEALPTDNLLNRVQTSGPDVERVSSGTQFALAEWLARAGTAQLTA